MIISVEKFSFFGLTSTIKDMYFTFEEIKKKDRKNKKTNYSPFYCTKL
jgi:hypothetical protein